MEQYRTDAEIYAVLEREIIDLTIRPGSLLSENPLCSRFAAPRSMIRVVLQKLQENGLVKIVPYKGTTVTRLNRRIVDELIYERTAVEARILRDFAPQCTPEQRALIRRRVEAYAALAATEEPDYNRLYEADRTLHGTWFAAMDKMYLWSTLQNAHADYSRFRMLDTITSGGLAEVIADHQNLIDAIRAIRNDKQDWADVRLMQEMCAGEPYGVLRLGDEESAAKINNHKLFNHYRELLATSRVEMFYCGSAKQERVQGALCRAFAALPRGVVTEGEPIRRIAAPEQPRYLTEEMDVTQGKLSMGWRCGTDDVPAMIMANLIFGGTSNAKLFLNVREKMSLCYYASSSYARSKGIMTVSSGIETKDFQKAHDEILHQLELVKQGQWEDWELQGALATMCSSLTSLSDSQGALENYCLGQTAIGAEDTPEDLMAALHQVTPERIRKAAQSCQLDTVFFLKGKEAATC